jgi:protoporphyrin/coproporphyrin ferrochelatase
MRTRHDGKRFGVLVMAHGTPESLDQMNEYLALVRGGRAPSAELIAEMRSNYAAIGGRSPLTEITLAQAAALRERLGGTIPVVVGMRNWRPFISDAVVEASLMGVERLVGIPMAPQFSTLSVGKYVDAALAALPEGLEFECIDPFYEHPGLVDAFAERLRESSPADGEDEVIFTAHSLPVRVSLAGDPYRDQVQATAAAVARRCGLDRYHLAFQSAGRTPEPWLGPDIGDLVRQLGAEGVRSVIVVPIGFVSDHTEILFDIDVQAAAAAREAGVRLRRTGSLNTSPRFIGALAELVIGRVGGGRVAS